ncbi:hypothetical protein Bhyg_05471 [Pseudolycoriella hygida]|uniref:Uncharacterized protein n=1 Tax=Pseudolycoriella hygida TaxID=35572 RepID=A0A9Q0S024_9DIPT|nr:hypothetical protein Bhyg_05471 [Pseudolycoriella hygida]
MCQTNIDSFPTVATFVDAVNSELKDGLNLKSSAWWDAHIKFGQYVIQIVKCSNSKCCGSKRSTLFDVLKYGKIPLLKNSDLNFSIPRDPNQLKSDDFASLFVNLALNLQEGAQCIDNFLRK